MKQAVSISDYGGAANYLALLNAGKGAMQKAYSHPPALPNGSPNNYLQNGPAHLSASLADRSYPSYPSQGPPQTPAYRPTGPQFGPPAGEQYDPAPSPVENQGPSAYDIYQQMVQQFNPSEMTEEQYAPQFAMLDRLNSDARSRYNTNNAQMGNMYGALQNSIRGDATGIKTNYDTAGKELATNYSNTQKSVAGAQSASKAQTAEIFKRLGIEAAAPETMASTDAANDVWNKLMASSNQRATTANTENKASSLDYNNSMQQRAGFEGKNQQAGLLGQFQDFLNQNEVKRLGIQSEKSQTQSGYQMKLMDMYKGMADSQTSSSNAQYKMQMDQAKADLDATTLQNTINNQEVDNNLEADKFKQSQMSPYDKLAQAAQGYSNIWGGPSNTSGMANLVAAQWQGKDSEEFMRADQSQSLNGQEFIRQLMIENPNLTPASQAALQSIGMQYFNNMYRK